MSDIVVDTDGIGGEVMRRSLHFFWIVDNSGSMRGEKIQTVNYAIKNILPEIKKIESQERIKIFMRAIRFDSDATWHVGPDPVPVEEFIWRDLDGSGSATSTAQAIALLNGELTLEKLGRRNVPPVIILLSDGYSTDPEEDYDEAIDTLDNLKWGQKAVRVSIGIGQSNEYDKEQLDRFISPYLRASNEANGYTPLETLPADTAKKLLDFIRVVSTQCVKSSSASKSDSNNKDIQPVSPFDFNDFTEIGESGPQDPNDPKLGDQVW